MCKIVKVTSWVDYYNEGTQFSQQFWFASYAQGNYSKKPSLWKRIKYAFWHLKTGEIYADNVTMTSEEAKLLADFINKEKL